MRIKSNFRDFYDGVQQYVYGPSSVYTRAWCKMSKSHDELRHLDRLLYRDILCVIGFCGNIYGFVKKFIKEDKINFQHEYDYVWNVDQLAKGRHWFEIDEDKCKKYEKYFFVKQNHDIFIEENCPIFFIDNNISVCCPLTPKNHVKCGHSLGLLNFQNAVDPETAYTSLVDYISFLGMEHKALPEMPNDVKIASHGFSKTSFCKKKS